MGVLWGSPDAPSTERGVHQGLALILAVLGGMLTSCKLLDLAGKHTAWLYLVAGLELTEGTENPLGLLQHP